MFGSGSKYVNPSAKYSSKGYYYYNNQISGRQGHLQFMLSNKYEMIVLFGDNEKCYASEVWKFHLSTFYWNFVWGTLDTTIIRSSNNDLEYGKYSSNVQPGSRYKPTGWKSNSTDIIYVFGGYGYENATSTGFFSDVFAFNVSSNMWKLASKKRSDNKVISYGSDFSNNLIGGRFGANAVFIDENKVFIMFGKGQVSLISDFSFLGDMWEFKVATGDFNYWGGSQNQSNFLNSASLALGVENKGYNPSSRESATVWYYKNDTYSSIMFFGGFLLKDSRIVTSNEVFGIEMSESYSDIPLIIALSVVLGSIVILAFLLCVVITAFCLICCFRSASKKKLKENSQLSSSQSVVNEAMLQLSVDKSKIEKNKFSKESKENNLKSVYDSKKLGNIGVRSLFFFLFFFIFGVGSIVFGFLSIFLSETYKSPDFVLVIQDICTIIFNFFVVFFSIFYLIFGCCTGPIIIKNIKLSFLKYLRIGRRTMLHASYLGLMSGIMQIFFNLFSLFWVGKKCSSNYVLYNGCSSYSSFTASEAFLWFNYGSTFRTGFLVLAYVQLVVFFFIYWINFFLSGTFKFLISKTGVMGVFDIISNQKKIYPVFTWSIVCYHYETRTRVVYYTDSNGRSQSRTETYQERVNTYHETIPWLYNSVADLSGTFLIDAANANRPFLKLRLDKIIIFDNVETESNWAKCGENLRVRNYHRDVHCDLTHDISLPGFQERSLIKMERKGKDFSQCFFKWYIYLLFSLFGLQIFFRYIFDLMCSEQVFKLIKCVSIFDQINSPNIDQNQKIEYIVLPIDKKNNNSVVVKKEILNEISSPQPVVQNNLNNNNSNIRVIPVVVVPVNNVLNNNFQNYNNNNQIQIPLNDIKTQNFNTNVNILPNAPTLDPNSSLPQFNQQIIGAAASIDTPPQI